MTWGVEETAGSIPERFEQRVLVSPDANAIAGFDQPLSYGDLGRWADSCAQALPAGRLTPPLHGGVAALLFGHGPKVMVAALAALKRGFAVVTLNASEPPTRHAQVREIAEPSLLLTDEGHSDQALAAGFAPDEIVLLSPFPGVDAGGASEIARAPISGPPSATDDPRPDDVAFLISTSGSAGQPKLVMQTHRNVLHNVMRYTNGLGIRENDRIAWVASLSGGQGLATAWTSLLNGATLCPFPIMERGVTGLSGWLTEQDITVLDTIPSVLRNFALTLGAERITGIRLLRLASEPGLRSDFEAFRGHFSDQCVLASVLASTEVGIMAQAILDREFEPGERLPVGSAAEGIVLELREDDGREVATGEPGEVVVTSEYLSPGYWRDDELTAQRFEQTGKQRRFHTGDVARRSEAGILTIVGRKDSQVKVRGHRLQLEEVEAAIAAQAGIAAVAVRAAAAARGDMRLTAFVVSEPGAPAETTRLRRALPDVLPPHAVPTTFIWVDALPLTPNGKVDRGRLAELESTAASAAQTPAKVDAHGAATEVHELLAALWRQAFDRDDIRDDDAFLDLGGDSLTAAVIAAGVYETFGVELELATFASEVTVTTLAELVTRGAASADDDPLPTLRRQPPPPASFGQRFMWMVTEIDPDGAIVANPYPIRGPVDATALGQSIEHVVHRHDVLRTTFTEIDGEVVQLVGPKIPVELPLFDLRDEPDPGGRAAQLLALEARCRFDLEHGPLVRFRLARLGEEEYRLLRINHHLVADAPSWRIFFGELAATYEALIAGRPPPGPQPGALQYADFAVWESACMRLTSRPHYQAEVEWWEAQLAQSPPDLRLPFTRTGPPDPDARGPRMIEWGLAPALASEIDRIGRDCGATYYMIRLALFSALLAVECDADDMLLETYITNRRRPELQDMIGLFINQALLRLRFRGAPSFPEWLAEVRRTVIETSANTTIPHTRLRQELRARGSDLPPTRTRFEALYQLEPTRFGGLEVERLPREQHLPRKFVLGVDPVYDAIGCRAVFDPSVCDPALVGEFLDRLQGLVAAICARPQTPLPELIGVQVR